MPTILKEPQALYIYGPKWIDPPALNGDEVELYIVDPIATRIFFPRF